MLSSSSFFVIPQASRTPSSGGLSHVRLSKMNSSSSSNPPSTPPAAASTAVSPATTTSGNVSSTSTRHYSKSMQVLSRMTGGVIVLAIPVCYWWYTSRQERNKICDEVRTKIRIPGGQMTMDEIMIEKHCQPGDVVVFDRRCETCATSPWAALACLTSQQFLCDSSSDNNKNKGGHRCFNHMGLIVPGYIRSRHDAHDATNLLLLEATPSEGIVARPLLQRLEHSQARSVWLLQLACPGEQRRTSTEQESQHQPKSVRQARQHVERQLIKFRNQWTELSQQQGYANMHSTLSIGGALAYRIGLLQHSSTGSTSTSEMTNQNIYKGPVSPCAWLCFMGLQQANAAQNIHDVHRQMVRVQDFVNVSTSSSSSSSRSDNTNDSTSEDVIRLRPGWRFLKPIALRENNAPQS